MANFCKSQLNDWIEESTRDNICRVMAKHPDLTQEQAAAIVTEKALQPIGPYNTGITMLSPLPGPSDSGLNLYDTADD